jgi:hypothetical protein
MGSSPEREGRERGGAAGGAWHGEGEGVPWGGFVVGGQLGQGWRLLCVCSVLSAHTLGRRKENREGEGKGKKEKKRKEKGKFF